jgi:hypothetical protein
MADNYINLPVESGGGGGGGVTSLNGLTGALSIVAGTGISVTPVGLTLVIATTGGLNAIGAYDSQPKVANALTLSGGILYAQSADATHPGMVSTGAQSFAGNKTFTGSISASNLSGTNTGDVTIGTANGLSLLGQVISLGLSSTSTTGALSSADWNTFNNKQAALTFPLAVNLGGTGTAATPTNGQLLIGNGSGYTLASLTAGTGIGVTTGPGSITITNSAVAAFINIDGGQANSVYGGASPIDCGGAT